PDVGRRISANPGPNEWRLFREKAKMPGRRRKKGGAVPRRSGAGNRDVVRAHRVQASAGKMVTYNLHAFDVARPFFLVVAVFFDLAAGFGAAAATSTAAGGALLNSTSYRSFGAPSGVVSTTKPSVDQRFTISFCDCISRKPSGACGSATLAQGGRAFGLSSGNTSSGRVIG